jgi:hypothetical protein
VNDVDSHSPNDHAGGSAGRPVRAVYLRSTSRGVGPYTSRYSSTWPGTLNCTRDTASEPTSKETAPGSLTNTP